MRWSLVWTCLSALAGIAGDAALTSAAADCICRAQGREYELGQSACLATPTGARIATCSMVLNNTSWKFTETPCVVSAVPPADVPEAARAETAHHHHGHGG
jgi:hypothetical protein